MPDTAYGRRTMRPGNDGTRVPASLTTWELASAHPGEVGGMTRFAFFSSVRLAKSAFIQSRVAFRIRRTR